MLAVHPAMSPKSLPCLWNGLSHTEGGVHCFHFTSKEAVVQSVLAACPGAADEPAEAEVDSEPLTGDSSRTFPSELMLHLVCYVTEHTEKDHWVGWGGVG